MTLFLESTRSSLQAFSQILFSWKPLYLAPGILEKEPFPLGRIDAVVYGGSFYPSNAKSSRSLRIIVTSPSAVDMCEAGRRASHPIISISLALSPSYFLSHLTRHIAVVLIMSRKLDRSIFGSSGSGTAAICQE